MTLEIDILNILKNYGPIQPSEIRNKLLEQPKYLNGYGGPRSLDSVISRFLLKKEKEGIVCRDNRGHQQVYYSLKEDARHKVEKAFLGNEIALAISNGKLAKATISKSKIQEQVYELRLDRLKRYLKSSSLLTSLKAKNKEAQFFLEGIVRKFNRDAQEFDITILHSKEKSSIELTEEDLLKSLGKEEERELIHAMFNMRGNLTWSHRDREGIPIHDSRLGEIWVILRYKPSSKPSRREILSALWNFEKKCFIEWLHQFKGVTCNLELLDYLCPWKSIKKVERLSSEDRKEIRKLRALHSKFSEKRNKYESIWIKSFQNK